MVGKMAESSEFESHGSKATNAFPTRAHVLVGLLSKDGGNVNSRNPSLAAPSVFKAGSVP